MKAREWRKVWLSLGATAALLAMVWLVGTALAQEPEGGDTLEGDVSLGAIVGDKVNYQGRLTDPGGAPLHGTFPMRFRIYDASGGGTMLWDSGVMSVDVEGGLFNVQLDIDPTDFNGQGLWLRIYVDGEWLTPRQELLPVPYALSLRPGAEITGAPTAWDGWVLKVNMTGTYPVAGALQGSTATGSAVYGYSSGGSGLAAQSLDGYAVYGRDAGTLQARGYGGYFTSDNGVGLYGHSSATSVASNVYAPGVYGKSENGAGVYGVGNGTSYPGYGGFFEGRVGVSAYSTGDSSEQGYAGRFYSNNYRGLYAESASGWYDAYFAGSLGILVENDIDVNDDVRIQGDLTVSGTKTGYVAEIALNDGPDALELGDVVVISGVAEPIMGDIPVPRVQKASEANSTGVMGVVDRRFVTSSEGLRGQETEAETPGYFEDSSTSLAGAGGITPGAYVGVVTLGSFQAIKVDASYGAIQPGDLLVSSETPGYAMKATDPQVGTVIGKALGSLDSGSGIIPVLITLQ
jgi:hypothetical protein